MGTDKGAGDIFIFSTNAPIDVYFELTFILSYTVSSNFLGISSSKLSQVSMSYRFDSDHGTVIFYVSF